MKMICEICKMNDGEPKDVPMKITSGKDKGKWIVSEIIVCGDCIIEKV